VGNVSISWQARNPDTFYTGLLFIDFETGERSYPKDAVIPKQTPYDREIIPKLIVISKVELSNDMRNRILARLHDGFARRNGH